MHPAIEMEDVVFRFWEDGKRNILDHTSLTLEAGRVTVLMGSSGCGKSTLAAVASGLYPENGGYLERGDIRLFGRSLKEMDPAERAVWLSMLFQNPDLQFCMDTLRRELIFCLENICVPREEMDARVRDAADKLGLTPLLDRKLTTLSGGEKQKAMLCCLYALGSRCILLDEPFANIDPASVKELVQLLASLKAEGRTVIAIDHRCDPWLPIADEIVILGKGGQTVARGITPETITDYRDVFEAEGLFYPDDAIPHISSDEATSAAITFKDVSSPLGKPQKRFLRPSPTPDYLLAHVDAEFPVGRMTAVLGTSGCGKTTTFLSVLKQHPYEGEIRFEGNDLAKIKPKQLYRDIGIVFQNPANQFTTQNVLDEVKASLRVWNPAMAETECAEKAEQLLESYGLLAQKKYSPYMLSQGQQRRLAVLSVLSGEQRVLLLDEPTYGQDLRSTRSIMAHLRQKIDEEGLTVIFITHDRELAETWADRIYLFEDKTLKEVR
ncbi:MAG: energy-coupling factor ABC transporter ATP-binding protein [Clostridia bacterium]|nr:energy-coupling factor ABC transporter ATP-binding protein [Clostridia bacterium]